MQDADKNAKCKKVGLHWKVQSGFGSPPGRLQTSARLRVARRPPNKYFFNSQIYSKVRRFLFVFSILLGGSPAIFSPSLVGNVISGMCSK